MYKDKPKLLDQLREALRLKHYSLKTEKSYVHWGRRFILFHKKRHPQEMGTPETQSFLNYLAVNLQVAAITEEMKVKKPLDWYEKMV